MSDVYDLCGYILSRVLQTLLVLLVLLYIWSSRALTASLFDRLRSILSRSGSTSRKFTEKQGQFRQRVADHFLKWRLDMHSRLLKATLPFLTLFAVVVVALVQDVHDLHFLFTRVFFSVFVYGFFVLTDRGTISLTTRFYDVFFTIFVIAYVGRLYADYRGIHALSKSLRRLAPALRPLVSLSYLNFPRVTFGNAIISVSDIVFYSMFVGMFDFEWFLEAFAQLLEFALILILAYVIEASGRSHVAQSLQAKWSAEGWRAVRSILSVLCDAVVQLGSDLTILDECPQLGHLLLSGIGVSQKLQGGNILRHVVDEDKQRLNDFIARQSEFAKHLANTTSDELMSASVPAAPAALHISLKDSMGTVFRVEVIHAHLPNFDEDGHLLGVRDLGDFTKEECIDGIPACTPSDEPFTQQHQSYASSSSGSSVSSASGEAQNWLGSAKLQRLSFNVDSLDCRFPIYEAALRLQSSSDESESSQETGLDLPSLFALLPMKSTRFQDWVQESSNCLHYDMAASTFGRVTLRPFGSFCRLKAQSASVTIVEETGLMQVCFDDVDVKFSEPHGRSTTSLPCIHETSPARHSSASTSQLLFGARKARLQSYETSHSRNGLVSSERQIESL
eukprot:TRINITY_DN9240_c0_g2_i1.p1 TRINITY_DN9240_c0_g2~~TRINITY_DN9240_c0_g2_i1.p1  ORF type:complete len:619 (+),score=32.48 TRINITY_DN9240_c0_g2_i1:69-1925(+)